MDRRRFFIGVGTGVAVRSAGCLGGEPDRPFPDADWRDEDGLDVATLSERHVEALVDAGASRSSRRRRRPTTATRSRARGSRLRSTSPRTTSKTGASTCDRS